MEIYQIAALGIVAAILSVTLKKDMPMFATLISIAAAIIIFIIVLPGLAGVIGLVTDIADEVDNSAAFLTPVLKIIGIAYISEFASQTVADAGETSLASKIEFAGKIIIMTVSAPIVLSLVEQVNTLLR